MPVKPGSGRKAQPRGPGPATQKANGQRDVVALAATALGIVYGDIGTSPLYAVRAAFTGEDGIAPEAASVLGIISLIFWALVIVISFKYLSLVLRADNRGEGGMLALSALTAAMLAPGSRLRRTVVVAGLCGAALLYADGVITPAISVLSAVEGVGVATPNLQPFVIPVTVLILVGLFTIQRKGTAAVGTLFAPITATWFTVIGLLGLASIVRNPAILAAINPVHGLHFLATGGTRGFTALGAVFLVVTGGEALYADMGHFGPRPIRLAWFTLVLPALLLNYFGQGASILADAAAAEQPFYGLAPHWALWPLVILATMATVIASQAVISGAFSITKQAVQLGFVPRLRIEHTSHRHEGQVYVPAVNWFFMIACIGLVIGFRSTDALAAAYGFAVSTDMVLTVMLVALLARLRWGWSWITVITVPGILLLIDLTFWGANLTKVPHGGWFPLLLAGTLFLLMDVWRTQTGVVARKLDGQKLADADFQAMITSHPPTRVPGTAVFMDRHATGVPAALLHNLKHNKVLHERVLLVTVLTRDVPRVPPTDRATQTVLGHGIIRIVLEYGFVEEPDVPAALAACRPADERFETGGATFFFGRETLLPGTGSALARAMKHIYAVMARNATPARAFFRIPPNRVVELGVQIDF
jgi:KUP system potassium uptake protein